MWEYVLEHTIDLVFLGVSSFLAYIATKMQKDHKEEKLRQKEKDLADTKYMIQQELRPVIEELHRLEKQIQDLKTQHQNDIDDVHGEVDKDIGLILSSYKFRLVQLCIAFLRQGYMTTDQFNQLSEFYKIYHGLNGNGQAQEYYERAIKLPIKDENSTK